MKTSVCKLNKIHSGLLYYLKNDDMFSNILIKKHNEVLASPKIVISDLKKIGKTISRKSVCSFLDSYGFNLPEKKIVLSILKKDKSF